MIIYNREWLERQIQLLELEQRQVREMRQELKLARDYSDAVLVDIFYDIIDKAKELGEHLKKTQDTLKRYENSAEEWDRKTRRNYDRALEQALRVFR